MTGSPQHGVKQRAALGRKGDRVGGHLAPPLAPRVLLPQESLAHDAPVDGDGLGEGVAAKEEDEEEGAGGPDVCLVDNGRRNGGRGRWES